MPHKRKAATATAETLCSHCFQVWFLREKGKVKRRRNGSKSATEDLFPMVKCSECPRSFHRHCLKESHLICSKQRRHARESSYDSDSSSSSDSDSDDDYENLVCSRIRNMAVDLPDSKQRGRRAKRSKQSTVIPKECRYKCIDESLIDASSLRVFLMGPRIRHEQVVSETQRKRVWRSFYESFTWHNHTYHAGDRVVIDVGANHKDLGHILDIFCDDGAVGPRMLIQWFIRKPAWSSLVMASSPKSKTKTRRRRNAKSKGSQAKSTLTEPESEWSENDRAEVYLAFDWMDEIDIHAVREPAMVHSSHDEWKSVSMDHHQSADLHGSEYFCTHGFKYRERKKRQKELLLLPDGYLERMQSTSQPMLDSLIKRTARSKKRSRSDVFDDDLKSAKDKLLLSAVPRSLPCREKERRMIRTFMLNAIKQKGYGSGLYISGMPGTGKTATVRQIARELSGMEQRMDDESDQHSQQPDSPKGIQTRSKAKRRKLVKSMVKCSEKRRVKSRESSPMNVDSLPLFRFVEINGMKLPTPQHAYSELHKIVFGKYCGQSTAVRKLEEYFATADPNRQVLVLLVDEMDYLLTRKQQVIYNLFNWPTYSTAHLVVLGIANTMDLPERLMPRVSSRLGAQRIIFTPYSRDQLTQIISSRLEEARVFSADAVSFCASSVASVSGDCRRALQICRRAVDLARERVARKEPPSSESESLSSMIDSWFKVTLKDIKGARDCFVRSDDVLILSQLRQFEQLFLTAVVIHNIQKKVLSGSLDEYQSRMDGYMSSYLGESSLNMPEMKGMLRRLQDRGIINVIHHRKSRSVFIRVNCQESDLLDALSRNSHCARILSQAGVSGY